MINYSGIWTLDIWVIYFQITCCFLPFSELISHFGKRRLQQKQEYSYKLMEINQNYIQKREELKETYGKKEH
jgi:hypothetical protein